MILGPTPVISHKYIAQALRRLGYQASSCVHSLYRINERSDFDLHTEDLLPIGWMLAGLRRPILKLLRPYAGFLHMIKHGDCLITFFDGGFLCKTPLQMLELPLLKWAGCRTILFPYGADCAVPTLIRSMAWRHGLSVSYPEYGKKEKATIHRLATFCRQADFIVAGLVHWETLPRWDLLTTLGYPIDTELWSMPSEAPARDRVVVVHSPNHRGMKGTEYLIAASAKLNAAGIRHELRLLENMSNGQVREALIGSDILVEQLLLGYAMSAMEGMALGKAVISNLTDDYYYAFHRASTGLDECPIVSATPETIETVLRELILNKARRKEIGDKGRSYMMKFHSLEANGRMWDRVLRHLWLGEPRPAATWHPGLS